MSELRRLQKDFQSYVLDGGQRMDHQVVDAGTVNARQRLDVYSEAYRLRLLEALANDYPGLVRLLGEEQFDRIGRDYVDAHPSNDPSIRWFGRHLPAFLSAHASFGHHPLYAEMAAFEWAQCHVFDAADSPVVTIEDMAAVAPAAWPQLRFTFVPSHRRLDLCCNAPTLWQELEQGRAPGQPQQSERPTPWILWRKDYRSHWRSLDSDEAWAIDAAVSGEDFATICGGLCEWIDAEQVSLHAATLLKRWMGDGLISSLLID